ncbi:putative bifunctional diguanylate cyclase/phosphodiesterase [Sciscionella marina]|uniref:putative bifunctional diguanylate cyclase/phosphodiesterase n=1 Tax=Sciscionella marina TaxID=508770 RepID=UPI00036358C5|nr:EAL domain-containing protein [Sciscionella marina]
MVQQREFSERAGWRTHAERVHGRGYRRYSLFVLALGVLGALAQWLTTEVHWSTGQILPALLITAGFLLAEACTTDINVGRIDYTISLTAIPIVIGLYTLPFPIVLAAHLVSGLAIQLGRRAFTHVLYNAGVLCVEIALPFLLFRLLSPVQAVPGWVVVVLAVLASSLASTGLGLGALQTAGAGLGMRQVASLGARTVVVEIVATMLTVAFYGVVRDVAWGWLFVVLLAGAMLAMFFAYGQLFREQRDLGALANISLEVARKRGAGPGPFEADGRQEIDAQWARVGEQIRDQIGADRIVLHLVEDDNEAVRTVIAGRALPEGCQPEEFWREDPLLQLPGTEVRYHRRRDAAEEVAAALRGRGAHEALVVPLRNSARLLGAVEAHDKASRWRGFGRADIRLLRTIANHLSTATDNQRLVARLRHDAYHDPQTGLLNRPGFLAAAGEQVGEGAIVLRADLDVLSGVSDALGQVWGDRMVVTAGQRLRDQLGPEVPLARIEGGQFAVLLDGSRPPEEIAERLRSALTATYTFGKLSVEAEAYLGFAKVLESSGEETDVTTLLQRADVALRTARSSAESVREHSPSMGSVFLRRFQLVTQFRQAVDRGEVLAYYQPKVALGSKQLLGFEALVRWRHPEFGQLSPDEFVPAVEATGLIDVLTAFVSEEAIKRIRAWLDNGLRMGVSVNLAVRSLGDDTLPEQVAEALERHGVPAELLTFEITESGVMANPERALPVLRRLHALGVVLALDDFGTGYSSLAYLRQLPVDEVKIDKSFVQGMGTDLGDLAVVRSIVELGHSLGLHVVAEGVEDDLSREALLGMDCDVAQGYLISRPLPEDKLEPWIRARTLREPGECGAARLTLLS